MARRSVRWRIAGVRMGTWDTICGEAIYWFRDGRIVPVGSTPSTSASGVVVVVVSREGGAGARVWTTLAAGPVAFSLLVRTNVVEDLYARSTFL